MQFIKRFLKEQEGTTSVEYAVMLVLILGAIISSVAMSGSTISNSWNETATTLGDACNKAQ